MRWLWIDRILQLEPGKRLLACKTVSLSEPHLHQHFPASVDRPAMPIAPGPLIIEGMAQTGGLLAGHARQFKDDVVLAKLRKAELHFEVLPGSTIYFDATLAAIDDSGASVDGVVHVADPGWDEPQELGRIDLMFAHVPAERDSLLIAEAFRTLIAGSVQAGGDGVEQMAV
ncbi:MAG: hypothetical protein ACIAS6_01645 [Phycisphaerales bacterium JB060]